MKLAMLRKSPVFTTTVASLALAMSLSASEMVSKTIRVGYLPATHDSLLFIAIDQKLFPSNLNVELSQGSISPELLNKLHSKAIDVAIPGVAAPINVIGEGSPFCMVGGAAKESAAVVVRKDLVKKFDKLSGEKALAAFSGMRIGSFKQSTGDAIFRMNIKGRNVILQDSYRSPSELISDLKGGKLDGAVLWSPHMTVVEQEGVGKIVLWLGDLMKNHVCCRQIVRDDYLKNNEEAVVGYLSGLIKAMVYYSNVDNKDRVISAVKKYIPTKEDIILQELYGTAKDRPRTTLSVDIDVEGIRSYATAMKNAGLLRPEQLKRVESSVNSNILKKAYISIGLTPAMAEKAVADGFNSVKPDLMRALTKA